MIQRAMAALKRGELLNEFIPCPQELRDTQAVYYPEGHPNKAQQDLIEKSNVDKYGYRNWYDWCIDMWGTKWDIGGEDSWADYEEDGHVRMSFKSAWAPPIGAYAKLEAQGFEVEAYFYERGMTFCGIYDNGDVSEYQIPERSKDVGKVIPSVIDEMFDITNSMSMWEDDEEDIEETVDTDGSSC